MFTRFFSFSVLSRNIERFFLMTSLVFLIILTGCAQPSEPSQSEDKGSATMAYFVSTLAETQFDRPKDLTVDADGNIYVSDSHNHRIQKITPNGDLSILAGSSQGFLDGIGTNAQFDTPQGIDVDASGNVYVADRENHRIRKITPSGEVSTLAGDGLRGNDEGSGDTASFTNPTGVVLDNSGNIYVTDWGNHRIRKIEVDEGGNVTVRLLAGSTEGFFDGTGSDAQFAYPEIAVVDNDGNVYVVDSNNSCIRKITPVGEVSTLTGYAELGKPDERIGNEDGVGTAARFNFPSGIARDTSGHLYLADTLNQSIRKITMDAEGNATVTTLAGSGELGYKDGIATEAKFNYPDGVAVDTTGNVYVADRENNYIRKISLQPIP